MRRHGRHGKKFLLLGFLICFFSGGFYQYKNGRTGEVLGVQIWGQQSQAYYEAWESGFQELEEDVFQEDGKRDIEESVKSYLGMQQDPGETKLSGTREYADRRRGKEAEEKSAKGAEEEARRAGEEQLAEDGFVDLVPGDKVVYLTFDDGPCESTSRLLHVLDELGVKATFFVTGQYFGEEELLAQLREIVNRGHTLAVHTYSHQYKEIYASKEAFWEDYERMEALVEKASGRENRLFRFPGGSNTGQNVEIRQELLQTAEQRGLIYHDWNSFVGDTEGLSLQQMLEQAVGGVLPRSKSVMLLHNTPDKDEVIEILPQIVEQLRQEGYDFAVLDETVRPFQFARLPDA